MNNARFWTRIQCSPGDTQAGLDGISVPSNLEQIGYRHSRG